MRILIKRIETICQAIFYTINIKDYTKNRKRNSGLKKMEYRNNIKCSSKEGKILNLILENLELYYIIDPDVPNDNLRKFKAQSKSQIKQIINEF